MKQIEQNTELDFLPMKEQCLYVVEILNRIADGRNLKLKLRKK